MVGQRMKPQENVSFRLKSIMPGAKKTLRRTFVSLRSKKNNSFSSGNKSSSQSFSVPGIMFPKENIYIL